MNVPLSRLELFIATERDRYPGHNNNRFTFALTQAARYERFVRIILDRHRPVSAEWRARHDDYMNRIREGEPGSRAMTPEEIRALEESGQLATLIHLEVESFYLFAKIFLDHIARFLEHYFGPVRGLSLDSHDDLARCFERYADAHGLIVPAGFIGEIRELKGCIADFRDYEIAHAKNPRTIYMTMWRPEGEPTIAKTRLYPTEREQDELQKESESLGGLMERIERHIDRLITLVVENREKSRYMRERAEGVKAS